MHFQDARSSTNLVIDEPLTKYRDSYVHIDRNSFELLLLSLMSASPPLWTVVAVHLLVHTLDLLAIDTPQGPWPGRGGCISRRVAAAFAAAARSHGPCSPTRSGCICFSDSLRGGPRMNSARSFTRRTRPLVAPLASVGNYLSSVERTV